ncbi:putative FG-GAP repeat protein, putative,intergrin alpha chain protein [Trypanosoma theileri]|uniref:Putative FG-GAP repeat protein, putative,intergrin alpha chain protein n=1 Tax=Trypanosoma theileri TaxID=67003 RepID=A0A1X0NSW9_9TRYP|nr:putative FG-GAP repeat protein, putative,intergrin alpha chain protein [Trypanosoma theileri]ORC87815.1 putative FG-GAP repeat protein, putative,intergrin alpha chain protein [Trypanosoma theileri]
MRRYTHSLKRVDDVLRRRTIANMTMTISLFFILMMVVIVNAAPVKWSQPLGNKAPKRPMIPEENMAPVIMPFGSNGSVAQLCRSGVHLEWAARVGSSVFATPRIVDLSHDGNKEILVPTYTQYLEALDGFNGEDVAGFPFVHPSFKSYASPLPVDMDGDGKTEWLVAMYTGELMVFGDDGKARGAVQIPSLPIKKNWMKKNLTRDSAVNFKLKKMEKSEEWLREVIRARRMLDMTHQFTRMRNNGTYKKKRSNPYETAGTATEKGDDNIAEENQRDIAVEEEPGRQLAGMGEGGGDEEDGAFPVANDQNAGEGNDLLGNDGLDDDNLDMDDLDDLVGLDGPQDPDDLGKHQGIGTDGWLSREARASMDLLYHPELYKSSVNYEGEKDAFNFHNMRSPSSAEVAEDEVAVDPHIMSTPVIVDVDGNGDLDVVLHVSFFFDPRAYEGEKAELLPPDIDMDDYVADAVMVVNLVTGEVKWLQVLHLTSKNDTNPAYALSSPAIANPNEDKQQEIYVTTTAGAIFGLSGQGKLLNGWPVWMGSTITAGVSMEDVDADGILDICAGDASGYVACYTAKGEKIWGRTFLGAVTDHITFGDIDGDGNVDLAFGTSSGLLYAVRGSNGEVLPHFPAATEGPILAPPLPVNLNKTTVGMNENEKGLHLVVPSHDGVLYIVSGTTGCVDGIDINEKSPAMVLADDMTGNGKLDLIVSTLSGSIMVFETPANYHPLKAWISRVKATNGYTASEGYVGVYIHPSSRAARDVRGDTFTLLVTIHDKRPGTAVKRRYGLTITIGPRVLVHQKVYSAPGTYAITMRTPPERMYASVYAIMLLPNGQRYEDSVALSFNMHFLESIKFTFLIPYVVACLAISFVSRRHEVEPPAFEPQYY